MRSLRARPCCSSSTWTQQKQRKDIQPQVTILLIAPGRKEGVGDRMGPVLSAAVNGWFGLNLIQNCIWTSHVSNNWFRICWYLWFLPPFLWQHTGLSEAITYIWGLRVCICMWERREKQRCSLLKRERRERCNNKSQWKGREGKKTGGN